MIYYLNLIKFFSIFVLFLQKVKSENESNNLKRFSRNQIVQENDNEAHKCWKEVPVTLLLESPGQVIIGNGTTNNWVKFEICCEGYKRYEYNWNICVPDCGNKCTNGRCLKPGECDCFPDHVKNENGDCINSCPLGSLNGKCNYDNLLICNTGYELHSSRKFCVPICDPPCSSDFNCTAPNRCECKTGYKYIGNKCRPQCNPLCKFGRCIEPNKCQCFPGYKLRNGFCQFDCKDSICDNGICEKDGCHCKDGYDYDSILKSCIPWCAYNCEKGICIEHNVCKCFKGYELKNGSCQAECPKGCDGGICEEYDKCRCPYGEVDKLGSCRDMYDVRCVAENNGYCTKLLEAE